MLFITTKITWKRIASIITSITHKLKILLTDEINCGVQCTRTEFLCQTSDTCIEYAKVCDGNNDCLDGSDENFCQNTSCDTKNNEFICNDLSCIEISLRCDGRPDCPDLSDEENCPGKNDIYINYYLPN